MSDEFLFADDEPALEPTPGAKAVALEPDPWLVLIVDDDAAVHATTKMVLRNFAFDGRPARFLSATSEADARRIIVERPDIAVIFLDVVMESDDTGLRLVHFIRNELGNRRARIILRTGQPGQAPERDIILGYDINDYKSKTELTAQKLFTTLVAALRGYQDIVAAERHRAGLERILNTSSVLVTKRTMPSFVDAALVEIAATFPECHGVLICGREILDSRKGPVFNLGGGGTYAAIGAKDFAVAMPEPLKGSIEAVFRSMRPDYGDEHSILVFPLACGHGDMAFIVGHHRPLRGDDQRLMEVLCSKIAAIFDNARLYEELAQLNRGLEAQVEERTRALSEAKLTAEQAQADAEAATRAKSLFLATMSHEIRTPMSGVQGMLELLEMTSLSADQREVVRVVRESADALLTIINDILDFSKIEAGRLDLENTALSLTSIVEGVADTLAPGARKKNLRLTSYVDPDLPAFIKGDPTRIRQVLFNITGNAIKFTPSGSVRISAEPVGFENNRLTIRIAVTDTGIGIGPDVAATLFHPFTQAEASTTRRFGGTGLGLSICHRLAALMGGAIGVDSAPGAGSTFWFTFPADVDETATDETQPLAGLSVMLALPDDTERLAVARYLATDGAQVLTSVDSNGSNPSIDVVVAAAVDEVQRLTRLTGSAGGVCLGAATTGGDPLHLVWPVRRAHLVRAILSAAGRSVPALDHPVEETATPRSAHLTVDIERARAEGRLILVAEDHPINRLVVARQLGVLGYACELAENGARALEMWRTGRYALLLTDCQMPELDGYELARRIRAEEDGTGTRLPIVAFTANAMAEEVQRCHDAGMEAALAKPVDLCSLRATIERYVPRCSGAEPAVSGATQRTLITTAPMDLDAIAALFGADDAVIGPLLREFVFSTRTSLAALETATLRRDADAARRDAHRIAGASRTLGAEDLADAADAVERAGMAGRIDDEAIGRVRRAFDRIVAFTDAD